MRKWPVYYAPVWSPDGAKLFYVVTRPDGALAVREVDVASRVGSEIGAGRFATAPAAMALSPQGDKVACAVVARDKGARALLRLHIISAGNEADQVVWETPCAGGAVELAWVPDGGSLVVAAEQVGGWGLHRVPAGGGAPRTLVTDLAEVRAPAVAPDCRRVAFVARARAGEPYALYVAALDSGARKIIVPAIFREFAVGYAPAWSPKGDALAYVTERYLCKGFAEIRLWIPAADESRALTPGRAGACVAPAWSPRGDAIAFVALPWAMPAGGPGMEGQNADILVADTSGKTTLVLAADGLANLMPAWSPDGQQVAFNTCGEPGATPHVVRLALLDGSHPRPAEDSAEATFFLAAARARRAGPVVPGGLAALAERLKEPAAAAFASNFLADLCAARGDWAGTAQHARRAAERAADAEAQAAALDLLARAQMHLADPEGALATLDLALSKRPSEARRALRQKLANGLQTLAALQAEQQDTPSPVIGLAIANTYLHDLGSPKKALDLLFKLLQRHPQGAHIRPAAESVLAASLRLGAASSSYRVLQWAARTVGEDTLTTPQLVLLASAAAANAEPRAVLQWLARVSLTLCCAETAHSAAGAALAAGDQLAAQAEGAEALAAYQRARLYGRGGAVAAQAAAEAAKLLARGGDHWAASRLLLEALQPEAAPTTRREALRLLAAGRIQRRDPLAYDIAEVGELIAQAFFEAALQRAEALIAGLVANDPRREVLRRDLAAAFAPLADWLLARGEPQPAVALVRRWMRSASTDDLPQALSRLAACYDLTGDRGAQVDALARLALDFPNRPEGAAARRQLLEMDTTHSRRGATE